MLKLRVTDVKQYVYCPRIIYFTYVCPVEKKITRKMEYGKAEHVTLDGLERRRTLRRYRLAEGQRHFHLRLWSERLALEGLLDLCLAAGSEYFPVEFKFSTRSGGLNHKYQLVSYAMLLEETYRRPVRYGLLYLVPRQEVQEVIITPEARKFVTQVLDRIRRIVEREVFPPATPARGRCRDCEYRRFCGDVG